MPRSSLGQTAIHAVIAGVVTAIVVAVFATGYFAGYASAWHDLYIQPAIVLHSAN